MIDCNYYHATTFSKLHYNCEQDDRFYVTNVCQKEQNINLYYVLFLSFETLYVFNIVNNPIEIFYCISTFVLNLN